MFDSQKSGTTQIELPLDDYSPADLLKIERLGREIRMVLELLSSFDVDTVSIVQNGPAPAWTTLDGDHVSFSMKHMPNPDSPFAVAVWMGTVAHELGHVKFSPRSGSSLMVRIEAAETTFMRGLSQLCNIVEDQRQERLILARFAPWTGYLSAALGHHLVADSESAWLLMCGRTWLPMSERFKARAIFLTRRNKDVADRVLELVSDYQRLLDPGETESDEAFAILEELYNIFADAPPNLPTVCTVMSDEAGQPETGTPGPGIPPAGDETPTPGEGEGQPGGDGSDDDKEDGEGSSEGQESKDDKSSDKSGDGAGTQPGTPKPPTLDDLRKQLQKAAEKQIGDDPATAKDLQDILDVLKNGRSTGAGIEGARPDGEHKPVSENARRLHREVADALVDLKNANEPGWDRRTTSGRLNVSRVLNPKSDPDAWFDRYEPGRLDTTDLEVVLLVDVSGSMERVTHALGEAIWAIRMTVDDLDGECSVVTWSSGPHKVLSTPGVRPERDRMFEPDATGGTNPESALHEAYRLLASSKRAHRMMVVLTDGDWASYSSHPSGVTSNERLIEAMRAAGIVTVLAFLPTQPSQIGKPVNAHRCEFAEAVDDPHGLARLFRRVAMQRMQDAAR
jgi:hypothetical protein